MKQLVLLLGAALTLTVHSYAQNGKLKKNSLLAYPVAFRLPETRWGIGASASYQFYMNQKDSLYPASQVQFGIAYTQNKQLLIYLPYALWWDERKSNLSGELGYYDYSYRFFGVGFDNNADTTESYEVTFPRFRVNYLREVRKHIYLGARWWYENYQVKETEEDGRLESGSIPGGLGSVTSGPGVVFLYDSRDNVFETRRGWYAEWVWHNQSAMVGSEFFYDRYRFDIRKFFALGKHNSIGLQAFGDFLNGDVPFSQMASIGGAKRMRGYYEGHFRDKNMLMFQCESRIKLYKRWGIAAFAQSAVLSDDQRNFSLNYSHAAAGLGLRFMFDNDKRLNLRLDYALSEKAKLVYFTVGEAF